MNATQKLRLVIGGDSSGASQALRGVGRDAGRTEGRMTRLASKAKLAGLAIAAGIGFAVYKLKGLADEAVTLASDLSESTNKARVVFGKYFGEVNKFAKRASDHLMMTRQEALESTATLGNLFVSMRLGAKPAAEMSTRMVQLATDLSSFNNVPVADALDAIRSGLIGESEPMRKFGVMLDDASLRQKALAMGLVKTTKEVLPPSVKAQAAYALILEKTKTAQGDAERTAGGLANSQKRLTAKTKELKTRLGEMLLPLKQKSVAALEGLVEFLDEHGVPVFKRFAKRLGDVKDALKGPLGSGMKTLAGSVKTVVNMVKGGEFEKLGEMLGEALKKALGKLADLGSWLWDAFKKIDWFEVGSKIGAVAVPLVIGFLSGLFDPAELWKMMKKHWLDVIITVAALVFAPSKFLGPILKIVRRIPFVGKLIAALLGGVNKLGGPIRRFIGDMARFFWKGLKGEFGESLIARAGRFLAGVMKRMWGAVTRFFRNLYDDIYLHGAELMERLGRGVVKGSSAPQRLMLWVGKKVLRALKLALWNPMADLARGAMDRLHSGLSSGWNVVAGFLNKAIGGLASFLGKLGVHSLDGVRIPLLGAAALGLDANVKNMSHHRTTSEGGGASRTPKVGTGPNYGRAKKGTDSDFSLFGLRWPKLPKVGEPFTGLPGALLKIMKDAVGGLLKKLLGSGSGAGILAYARQFLGVPYLWGGVTPSGFDCSGLVQYVYRHFGYNLPRVATAQSRVGAPVGPPYQLGDLLFFGSPAFSHHVGMFAGNGMMIDAPHTGANVSINPIYSDFWGARRIVGAMRPAKAALYDKGGYLPPGVSIAVNKTGRPERVVGPGESSTIVIDARGALFAENAAKVISDLAEQGYKVKMRQRSRTLGLAMS